MDQLSTQDENYPAEVLYHDEKEHSNAKVTPIWGTQEKDVEVPHLWVCGRGHLLLCQLTLWRISLTQADKEEVCDELS